jgi:hypothetical protein
LLLYRKSIVGVVMTERTAVTESEAKKLCFAGEESGVGFVVARKKHAETRGKHVALSALFPGVTEGNA